MKRRAKVNEIETEYWMDRRQKIKALMEYFGYTRKEAEEWLETLRKEKQTFEPKKSISE